MTDWRRLEILLRYGIASHPDLVAWAVKPDHASLWHVLIEGGSHPPVALSIGAAYRLGQELLLAGEETLGTSITVAASKAYVARATRK
jgi:hypothetical protein